MRRVNFSVLGSGAVKYGAAIKGYRTAVRARDYVLLDTDDLIGSPVVDPEMAVLQARVDLQGSIDALKASLLDVLALVRYRREVGGVTLPSGASVLTTRGAQSQIGSTFNALSSGLISSVDWKAESGWVTLSLVEFEPIAQAVADHVQRCFSSERAVGASIAAADDSAVLLALDVAGDFDAEYQSRAA